MVTALWGPAYPTGSGVYAYELACRMANLDHDVTAYTSDVGVFNGFKYPDNLKIVKLKSRAMMWEVNPVVNIFPSLLQEDYDIIHAHSYLYFISNLTALAQGLKDSKLILHFHGGLNHPGIENGISRRMWMKEYVFDPFIGKFTVKMADKCLSVAKSDIPIIRKKFNVDAEFVPNAVESNLFAPKPMEKEYITYVGKLETWKGLDVLLKAFTMVRNEIGKNIKFRIIGEGSLLSNIQGNKLDIEMTGHVPHYDMPKYYNESLLTILPSNMEGSPTTCMESLSCGVPVIATDVGDTRDIVDHGRSGYLVSPNDPTSIANYIVQLLSDEKLRIEMGLNGRNHILNNYSYEAVINKLISIYKDI